MWVSKSREFKPSILEYSHFPKLVREVDWNVVPDVEYKKQVKIYVANIRDRIKDGRGLYLWGLSGSGKTYLACLIAFEAHKVLWPKARLAYIHSYDIASFWINNYPFDEEDDWQFRLETADLLVIDDLHCNEKAKDDFTERLLRLRIHNLRSMIITSNVPPNELKSDIIKSLLPGKIFPICVDSPNFRIQNKLTGP